MIWVHSMKIGFIGCVHFSEMALNTIIGIKSSKIDVVAAVTKKNSSYNSDYVNLAPICKKYNIPVHFENTKNKALSVNFMKQHKPDVIFCFGWSHLLNEDFLTLPKLGVIGFHPAKLPKNRGRHPIIWSLALGQDKTASTFFRMEKEADSGPILSQIEIDISHLDNSKDLYKKIMSVAREQIINITEKLYLGTAEYKPQDHSVASSWRKRTRSDGEIDWRMSAYSIYNLIRALSKPYPGAEFKYKGQIYQAWASEVCVEKIASDIVPGCILAVHKNKILVKCAGRSALWLLNTSLDKLKVGEYL